MKKLVALLLTLVVVLSFVACNSSNNDDNTNEAFLSMTAEQYENAKIKSEGVMTYAEYVAAAIDSNVVVEVYVQATQSWYDGKITVYAADLDGAYFLYNMACAEEDAAKLTAGTKIKVTGKKITWSGEIEVGDATFEFVNKENDTYVAPALKINSVVGKDALVNYQNALVNFAGAKIVAQDDGAAIKYKGGERGDDVYFKAEVNGTVVSFCIERYLTGPDTDVYKAVEALKVGDVVDIQGFLYWYEGAEPHVTSVTAAK